MKFGREDLAPLVELDREVAAETSVRTSAVGSTALKGPATSAPAPPEASELSRLACAWLRERASSVWP